MPGYPTTPSPCQRPTSQASGYISGARPSGRVNAMSALSLEQPDDDEEREPADRDGGRDEQADEEDLECLHVPILTTDRRRAPAVRGHACRAARSRTPSRYSSQPRQSPNTAFSVAATSASAAATGTAAPTPSRASSTPPPVITSPTTCANRGGRGSSRSAAGASRGRTSAWNSSPW